MARFEGFEGFVLTMPDDLAHASAIARFDGFPRRERVAAWVRGWADFLSVSVAVLMVAKYVSLSSFGKAQ